MDDKYISVTQLTRYIKYKFDNDTNLNTVYLRGEISNFKAHTRGHLYFTIKDEGSRINAVMFSSNASKLNFQLEDGMKVLVTGRISVYEATGGYQIYVDDLLIDGVGNLFLEYEKLKKKLAEEGLFDPDKKKPIPKFPNRIGIITAPTGAAIRDILSTIKRRWPVCETILLPSLVQGKEAAPDIVRQIENAENYDLDVLIVGRGGGSIEDMWCFNEEIVARALSKCSIPVISAVGHEVDYTIADFVADRRAPTPTGAAEMAVPNKEDFYKYINQVNLRLKNGMIGLLNDRYKKLDNLKNSYILKNPISIYEVKEQKFDTLFEKLNLVMDKRIKESKNILDNIVLKIQVLTDKEYEKKKNILDNIVLKIKVLTDKEYEKKRNIYLNYLNKLEALNPILTLKRGYSITKVNDQVVTSVKNIKKNDNVSITLTDGTIKGTILEVDKK